jgi:hypothetical protein
MSSTFEAHCGQCGALLPAGATACPRCGAPVTTPQPGTVAPTSGGASEFFPGIEEQIDSADTLIRVRPEEGWNNQPSGAAPSFPPTPTPPPPSASGMFPGVGQMPPASPAPAGPAPGQLSAPLPSPSGASWPTPAPAAGLGAPLAGVPQFGTPAAGLTPSAPSWPLVGSSPQAPLAGPPSGVFPGMPGPVVQGGWPSGEMFAQPGAMPPGQLPTFGGPTGTFNVPPGAYAPGYSAPGGAPGPAGISPLPGMVSPPPKPPLPVWFVAGAAGLVAVGLLLIALVSAVGDSGDWAAAGLRVGIASLVVGVVVLGVFLFRFNQGYNAKNTVRLAISSVVVLVILGGAGIGLQGTLRGAQVSSLESQENYARAVQLYQSTGDNEAVARIYNDWGEQLANQHQYQVPNDPTKKPTDGTKQNSDGAINKFEVVLNHYSSQTAQATRALNDEAQAYLDWGNQYVNVGTVDSLQKAIAAFNVVLSNPDKFSSTSVFAQVRQQAAKAYLTLGQQQESSDCEAATTTLSTLVKNFAGTDPANSAMMLLQMGSVTGQVLQVVNSQFGPPAPNVKLFLSKTWSVSNQTFQDSKDYTTTSDADGNFTFTHVLVSDPSDTDHITMYLISYIGSDGREEIAVNAAGQPVASEIVEVTQFCTAVPANGPIPRF